MLAICSNTSTGLTIDTNPNFKRVVQPENSKQEIGTVAVLPLILGEGYKLLQKALIFL
jgi:hypothetical protein